MQFLFFGEKKIWTGFKKVYFSHFRSWSKCVQIGQFFDTLAAFSKSLASYVKVYLVSEKILNHIFASFFYAVQIFIDVKG